MSKAEHKPKTENEVESELKETCGIIMPISANDGYTAEHWNDVKNVLEEVIDSIDYIPNLVSDADEIGIIHNRIVTNIYNNPIVICDVSSKNPNVMFELGLRLAFDKATIIIKDDATNYNFDTAPIEHLTYPRDLRYSSINKFKSKLKEKLSSTITASKDPAYSTFLKHFVQYKPKLETQEISSEKFILKQLDDITKQLSYLRNSQPIIDNINIENSEDEKNNFRRTFTWTFIIDTKNETKINQLIADLQANIFRYSLTSIENDKIKFRITFKSSSGHLRFAQQCNLHGISHEYHRSY